jgi:uncharacterized protein YcbK (DUF882 family)
VKTPRTSWPSEYILRRELACKCGCGMDTVDAELLVVLHNTRVHFDSPLIISSGNRCPKYNARVGGSKNSMHMRSRAADIVVVGVDPAEVYRYLDNKYTNRYGVGNYWNFTHIDTRAGIARW